MAKMWTCNEWRIICQSNIFSVCVCVCLGTRCMHLKTKNANWKSQLLSNPKQAGTVKINSAILFDKAKLRFWENKKTKQKSSARGYLLGEEKLRLAIPLSTHTRTRANIISNCFIYLIFSSFFQIDHNEHSL